MMTRYDEASALSYILSESKHITGYINNIRSKGKETLILHVLFTVSERYTLCVPMFI
jgi:hypothetical protein